MKATLTILAILLILPIFATATEPGLYGEFKKPETSFIAPYPDEWDNPIISLNLNEEHPAFNYKLNYTSPPTVASSSWQDSTLTFSYTYYRLGRDTKYEYVPRTVNARDYMEFRRRSTTRREMAKIHSRSLAKEQRDKQGGLFSMNVPIDNKTFTSIFGVGGAGLNVSGYHRINMSGRSSWSEGASTPTHRQNKFPSLNMEQVSRFDINGTIGSKITVSVSHDSKTDIPLANRLMLRYRGDEDDILKSVEAGNTNLSLPNTKFVGYSQNIRGLFGLKSEAQIGNLYLTAIASQEKGNSERTSIEAGASARKDYIRDYQYAYGRIFDLGRIDTNVFTPQEMDFAPGDSITYIEVYVASNANVTTADVTDPRAEFWVDPTDTTLASEESQKTNVKVVDPEEYIIQPTEHWILFERANAGTQNEIGVYMTVRRAGGTVDTIGSLQQEPYQLKLLRLRTPTKKMITWNYEWKNVYSLQARNIDVDGLEINVLEGKNDTEGNESNLDHQDGIPYIRILGLDRYTQSGELGSDGIVDVSTPIIDAYRGLLIFPDRRPFDPYRDFVSNTPLKDRVPEIYDSNNNQDKVTASSYYLEISNHSRNTDISLGKPNIIEGSERITLNGRELKKGVDYNINYDFGQVTFLTEDALDPNADMNIDFEYSPFITAQKKTLFGMRGEYQLSDDFKVGSTFLYKSDKATERKPKVGQETAKAMVWDADMSLRMEPNFMTDIVNVLPFYASESNSNLQLSAEIAQSYPNPNVDGVAYIDDFEGSRDSYSLGIFRENWTKSSEPKGFDSTRARGNLVWFNPYNQIATNDIWNRDLRQGESGTHTLWFQYTPPESVLVIDTLEGGEVQYEYVTVDPTEGWAGIMRAFTAGSVNQDRAELLELRMRGGRGIIHFEFGDISEDINGNGVLEDEDITTADRQENGILDSGEDVGLDGLADENEPGYDATLNPDPNGDDWYYNGYGIGCNGCGPYDYSHINGTEGNGDDPGRLGRPDSEDIDNDNNLDITNNYHSYSIDLAAGDFLVDSSEYNGWKTYRIPIRKEEFIDTTVGDPDWARTNFVRVWIESPDGAPDTIAIASMDLIQSNWEDSLIALDSLTTPTIFSVAVINNQENTNYVSPPGVEGYYDKTTEYQEPEQSLLLKYENLEAGDTCLASRVLFDTPNYVGYKSLRMWVHGDAMVDTDSILYFFRIGTDERNYYEFRTLLQPGWDSANQVSIDFADITLLKEHLLEAMTENPDTNQIYSDDGTYRVFGNPTFTRVKYMASGVVNLYDNTNPSGEVWTNELRLTDVRRDKGAAARASVSGNVSDLFSYNAGYEYMDSYFRGISSSTRGGSSNNLGSGKTRTTVNYGISLKLDKFLPRSFGATIPVSYRYSKTTEVPRLRFGTDIELPPELQQQETTINESKSVTISESFNKNTKNPLFTVLLNKFRTSFSYNRSEGTSPRTPMSLSENYRLGTTYSLNINQKSIPNITPFFWTKPIPFLKKLSGNKFYFIPNNLTMSGNLNRNLSISKNSSDLLTQSIRRTFDGNLKTGYRISEPLTVNYSMNTQRDLNNPDLVNISLDPKKFKLGRETSYGQSIGASYNPNIFSFLTHTFNYTVSYRENLNVRDTSLSASQAKSYGVSGVFDHHKLFGIDSRRPSTRSRGRRGNDDNVIVAEKDKNIFQKMVEPFAKVLGFLTGWVEPINYDYNEKYNYSYSGMLSRASWEFRLGLSQDIGTGIRPSSTGLLNSGTAITRSTGYTFRSGTRFFGGIKTDVTFNRKISQDVVKTTNPRKTVSTTFPDIKFTIQPLSTFKFLNPFIRKFSPRTSYSRQKSEITNIQTAAKTSEQTTINMRPLIALNVNVLNGVTINFSRDYVYSEDKTFNSQTSDLSQVRKNTQTSTSFNAKYSFTSPKGIKLPIFGRIKFKSTMSIQCDVSIRKQKSESASPSSAFNESEGTSTSGGLNFTPTSERSDLVISPIISYSFSQQIKGGITCKWQTSKDAYANKTTQTRELRIWVDIRF